MLDVCVSKSVRNLLIVGFFVSGLLFTPTPACCGWHDPPSSFAMLRFTSVRLASRWMIGHRSPMSPKRVSTDAIAVRSTKSCVCGTRIVPDIGDEPNERAATTSKYRNACFIFIFIFKFLILFL